MENENSGTSKISFASPEWLKSFTGAPTGLGVAIKETLQFNASCLQDQADYLKKLAGSANPAEAMKCQLDFVQQSWARCTGEAWRLLNSLRASVSSGPNT